jgi:hypothetical protein
VDAKTQFLFREKQARQLKNRLLKAGVPSLQKSIVENAIVETAPVKLQAAQVGLRSAGRTFVLHHGVVGKDADKIVPPSSGAQSVATTLRRRGALADFQEKLVPIIKCSSPLILACSAVFAAPLLGLLNMPSFGLVFHGPTRCGKSTAQTLAASMIGFGSENELPSLCASHSALMSVARMFNHHIVPINELATASGKKTDIYTAIRDFTYQLMNGQDKLRHPSWNGDAGRSSSSFNSIFLFSSEMSPDAWAARNGSRREPGEISRLIGVPVTFAGRATIFDRAPKCANGDPVGWDRRQFERIRRYAKCYRGTAFPAFASHLVKNRKDIRKRVAGYMQRFEESAIVGEPSSIQREIIAYFSMVYAGGAMASDAGIFPLSREQIGEAILRCCKAALTKIPDARESLRKALARLSKKLRDKSVIADGNAIRKKSKTTAFAGWVHKNNREHRYVIRATEFVRWFDMPLHCKEVLEWLETRGYLQHRASASKIGRGISWAERQVSWLDGTRPRSIEIILPKGSSELTI